MSQVPSQISTQLVQTQDPAPDWISEMVDKVERMERIQFFRDLEIRDKMERMSQRGWYKDVSGQYFKLNHKTSNFPSRS